MQRRKEVCDSSCTGTGRRKSKAKPEGKEEQDCICQEVTTNMKKTGDLSSKIQVAVDHPLRLQPQEHGEQAEFGDSPTQLSCHGTLPVVMCPALVSPTLERHGPVGRSPKEAIKALRVLENLFSGTRLEELGVCTWRREGSRNTLVVLPGPKGALREMEKDFGRACSDNTRVEWPHSESAG